MNPRPVVLALGSNLGDRLANLQSGIDALAAAPRITATAVSAVFETSPFLGTGKGTVAVGGAYVVAGGPWAVKAP